MTLSQSIHFIKKSEKEDIKLFCFFMVVFLIIYGAMLTKLGYNHDELELLNAKDPYTWCVAMGRWFFALWKWIIGFNPNSFTFGIISSVFISLSLVILTKSLALGNWCTKAVFGIIYLVQIQFAHTMEFSFQIDVVSFGLVLTACSTILIQKKGVVNFIYSVVLLSLALATYQSLILNFCIILLFLLHKAVSNSDWKAAKALLFKLILCSLSALTLYYVTVKLSIILTNTSSDTVAAAKLYQSSLNTAGKIGLWNIKGLIGQLIFTLPDFTKTLIYPQSYQGEWVYSTALIPLSALFITIFKQKEQLIKKACQIFIMAGIWAAPFLLILAFLNPNAMLPHNRMGEPLALACLWTLAIPKIKWTKTKGILFVCGLVVLVMKGSYYVSEVANSRRHYFESYLSAHKEMEFEAARKAADAGISLSRENILLFRFGEDGPRTYNTMLNYPALAYANPSRTSVEKQYPEYREVLEQMPCWPASDSIKIHKGKVIVKFTFPEFSQTSQAEQ